MNASVARTGSRTSAVCQSSRIAFVFSSPSSIDATAP
jgi:hypothetical protein